MINVSLFCTLISFLKSVTWLPLPWPRRRPPLRHVASLIPPGGNSVRPTFHLLWIFHNRRLPPDGREVRFNFLGHTCSDPLATLTRSTSAADDSDYLDNLTRHTLAICRIHLCPQLRSKLRQHYRPSLLNYHSSSIQDTLDKTLPNILRLPDAFPVPKIIN